MSRFLLDTNVISELRKPKPHRGVLLWFETLTLGDWLLPAIVFGELQAGIERIRTENLAKAAELEEWLNDLISRAHVIDLDVQVCIEWAKLMSGKSRALSEDGFIAACARVHGLIVVTRNTKDFEQFEVRLFNPFLSKPN